LSCWTRGNAEKKKKEREKKRGRASSPLPLLFTVKEGEGKGGGRDFEKGEKRLSPLLLPSTLSLIGETKKREERRRKFGE